MSAQIIAAITNTVSLTIVGPPFSLSEPGVNERRDREPGDNQEHPNRIKNLDHAINLSNVAIPSPATPSGNGVRNSSNHPCRPLIPSSQNPRAMKQATINAGPPLSVKKGTWGFLLVSVTATFQ